MGGILLGVMNTTQDKRGKLMDGRGEITSNSTDIGFWTQIFLSMPIVGQSISVPS
jgi:hypothetical protein